MGLVVEFCNVRFVSRAYLKWLKSKVLLQERCEAFICHGLLGIDPPVIVLEHVWQLDITRLSLLCRFQALAFDNLERHRGLLVRWYLRTALAAVNPLFFFFRFFLLQRQLTANISRGIRCWSGFALLQRNGSFLKFRSGVLVVAVLAAFATGNKRPVRTLNVDDAVDERLLFSFDLLTGQRSRYRYFSLIFS